jgi:hypothetical protein
MLQAQCLEAGTSFDMARLVRLGAYGLLLDGPVGHMWYRCASPVLTHVLVDSGGKRTVEG